MTEPFRAIDGKRFRVGPIAPNDDSHALFTRKDVHDGHDFGMARLEQHFQGVRTALSREVFACFVNCDDANPNCKMVLHPDHILTGEDGDIVIYRAHLVATKWIRAGSELTCSYTLSEYGRPGERPWD